MAFEVTISTFHPQLGRLYWRYSTRSDRYFEFDYRGFTSNPAMAMRLPAGWRSNPRHKHQHARHLSEVFDPHHRGSECIEVGAQHGERQLGYYGTLRYFLLRSGQTPAQFREWMLNAAWVDTPALTVEPVRLITISAVHPTLGRLYWRTSWLLENGNADFFGLTTTHALALRLPRGWETDQYLAELHGEHIEQVLDPNSPHSEYYRDEGYENDDSVLEGFEGSLAALHERSGQTMQDFMDWMRAAKWSETPALVLVPVSQVG